MPTGLAPVGSCNIKSMTISSTNARALGRNLQQTGKYLHAIGYCSVEEDHDADAREAEVTPESIRNERWTLVFDLMVHPDNKRRNSGESNN